MAKNLAGFLVFLLQKFTWLESIKMRFRWQDWSYRN